MKGSNRIYIVNLIYKLEEEGHADDYCMIPYSSDIVYAMKYAEERDIDKNLVIAMTPEAFDNMRRRDEEGQFDFLEIFEANLAGKTFHVVETELDYLDTIVDELCTDTVTKMIELNRLLKYFDSKDISKLREILKKFIKKDKFRKYTMMDELNDNLNINKLFDRIIIKEKGDL